MFVSESPLRPYSPTAGKTACSIYAGNDPPHIPRQPSHTPRTARTGRLLSHDGDRARGARAVATENSGDKLSNPGMRMASIVVRPHRHPAGSRCDDRKLREPREVSRMDRLSCNSSQGPGVSA